MIEGAKLNLVSMPKWENEQILVVVQLEQFQQTHGEARKDRPPLNHICGMLARYKNVPTNRLLKKKLPPKNGK